jgi:hypothetical protein
MKEKIYKILKTTILCPKKGSIIIMLLTLSMTVGLVHTGIILLQVLDSIIHYIF